MNSPWISLQFFVLILAELTVLFLAISTLVGLVFEYISDETVRRWLARKGWLGNVMGAVIGAVPAGATVACHTARRGLKTILLEKEHLPRHKIVVVADGANNMTSNGSGRAQPPRCRSAFGIATEVHHNAAVTTTQKGPLPQ